MSMEQNISKPSPRKARKSTIANERGTSRRIMSSNKDIAKAQMSELTQEELFLHAELEKEKQQHELEKTHLLSLSYDSPNSSPTHRPGLFESLGSMKAEIDNKHTDITIKGLGNVHEAPKDCEKATRLRTRGDKFDAKSTCGSPAVCEKYQSPGRSSLENSQSQSPPTKVYPTLNEAYRKCSPGKFSVPLVCMKLLSTDAIKAHMQKPDKVTSLSPKECTGKTSRSTSPRNITPTSVSSRTSTRITRRAHGAMDTDGNSSPAIPTSPVIPNLSPIRRKLRGVETVASSCSEDNAEVIKNRLDAMPNSKTTLSAVVTNTKRRSLLNEDKIDAPDVSSGSTKVIKKRGKRKVQKQMEYDDGLEEDVLSNKGTTKQLHMSQNEETLLSSDIGKSMKPDNKLQDLECASIESTCKSPSRDFTDAEAKTDSPITGGRTRCGRSIKMTSAAIEAGMSNESSMNFLMNSPVDGSSRRRRKVQSVGVKTCADRTSDADISQDGSDLDGSQGSGAATEQQSPKHSPKQELTNSKKKKVPTATLR